MSGPQCDAGVLTRVFGIEGMKMNRGWGHPHCNSYVQEFTKLHSARPRRVEFLLDPLGVMIHASLMQDQFGCTALAIRHESDLRIDDLEKIFSVALWKYFHF